MSLPCECNTIVCVCEFREGTVNAPTPFRPTERNDASERFIARLRTMQMSAATAMDHAIRASATDDHAQRRARIEQCCSAIAACASACADAAYELAMCEVRR